MKKTQLFDKSTEARTSLNVNIELRVANESAHNIMSPVVNQFKNMCILTHKNVDR